MIEQKSCKTQDLAWFNSEGYTLSVFCVKSYARDGSGWPAEYGYVCRDDKGWEVSLRDLTTNKITGVRAYPSLDVLFDEWMVD